VTARTTGGGDRPLLLVNFAPLIGAGPRSGVLVAEVALRPVEDSDLDALFDQMRDPESVRMAALTAEDPDDRTAFDVHMAKIRASPGVTNRAITVDGRLVGSIASFVIEGDTEVTYWIDRSCWGQGIAGRALALLLESVPARPLFARVASDNAGSLRVLRRAGSAVTGTEISFANARRTEIEETILRLDGPAKTAEPY
jgi:RimJ/RimL family protein N-acetyltransferase